MRRFDESELARKIEQLAKQQRVAFAAACAQRLFPSYNRFAQKTGRGNSATLMSLLEALWKDLNQNQMSEAEIDSSISVCMGLIPQEEDQPWVNEQACAEDAASAVVYALRCRRTGETQEAAWAARRAYDCLDHYVISSERIDTNMPGQEERVLSHSLIQAELDRQHRDLDELHAGSVTLDRLQNRAKVDSAAFLPL
jgi:uncharacterized protein YjaG (DUF416 family)